MQLSTLRIISIWQSICLMVVFKPKTHGLGANLGRNNDARKDVY